MAISTLKMNAWHIKDKEAANRFLDALIESEEHPHECPSNIKLVTDPQELSELVQKLKERYM